MSKQSVDRTQKIVRHRQFKEDLAQAELQIQSRKMKDAQQRLMQTQEALEAASQWKFKSGTAGGLDMTLYQQALQYELLGMQAVQEASSALTGAATRQQEASDLHLSARNGTRVASTRLDRVSGQWHLQQERSLSDQVADLWLANKEKHK